MSCRCRVRTVVVDSALMRHHAVNAHTLATLFLFTFVYMLDASIPYSLGGRVRLDAFRKITQIPSSHVGEQCLYVRRLVAHAR
jgi:hypothetical protein